MRDRAREKLTIHWKNDLVKTRRAFQAVLACAVVHSIDLLGIITRQRTALSQTAQRHAAVRGVDCRSSCVDGEGVGGVVHDAVVVIRNSKVVHLAGCVLIEIVGSTFKHIQRILIRITCLIGILRVL